MKKLFIILTCLLVILTACNVFGDKLDGYIVGKSKRDKRYTITVVSHSDMKESEIKSSTEENMKELANLMDEDNMKEAITFSVEEHSYNKATLGDQVIVKYNSGSMAESYPPQTHANQVLFKNK
ncbi:DUF3221 domain-containing protein [Halobacillus halophilus]|uniref:DUF3221 domain-containing protein n=1 Tax=Halobacillus halophilus TaxID=1570 RepID=UPI001CD80BDE|nr:DUF3221 domain-containing protein [Halobacillus halophilus]MCA1011594.1 YobA family protein [Halobacillus halophilus]